MPARWAGTMRLMAALLALPVAGVLLALSGLAGADAVGVLVLTAVLLLAVSVSGAFGLREGRGPATAVGVAGAAALALTLIEPERADGRPDLVDVVLPVLAGVFLLGAIAQLTRRGGRTDLVASLAITVGCSVVAVVGVLWVPLAYTPIGTAGAAIAGFAIAAAGAVLLLGPWWAASGRPADPVIAGAVIAGPVGGALALLVLEPGAVTWVQVIVLGAIASASAVIGRSWVLTAVDERVQAMAGPMPTAVAGSSASSVGGNDRSTGGAEPSTVSAEPSPIDVASPPAQMPDADQALIVATTVALLIAAGPVYVAARVLVG